MDTLRIVKTQAGRRGAITPPTLAVTCGADWVRGGTWTHNLGDDAQIGLVSMGGSGFTAEFDYVRTFEVKGKE